MTDIRDRLISVFIPNRRHPDPVAFHLLSPKRGFELSVVLDKGQLQVGQDDLQYHLASIGKKYGLGLMQFTNAFMPSWLALWGHSGSIGSYLYYNEQSDVYFAGTYSKVGGVVRPFVAMVRALLSLG